MNYCSHCSLSYTQMYWITWEWCTGPFGPLCHSLCSCGQEVRDADTRCYTSYCSACLSCWTVLLCLCMFAYRLFFCSAKALISRPESTNGPRSTWGTAAYVRWITTHQAPHLPPSITRTADWDMTVGGGHHSLHTLDAVASRRSLQAAVMQSFWACWKRRAGCCHSFWSWHQSPLTPARHQALHRTIMIDSFPSELLF